jgi:hypothetical protein
LIGGRFRPPPTSPSHIYTSVIKAEEKIENYLERGDLFSEKQVRERERERRTERKTARKRWRGTAQELKRGGARENRERERGGNVWGRDERERGE